MTIDINTNLQGLKQVEGPKSILDPEEKASKI